MLEEINATAGFLVDWATRSGMQPHETTALSENLVKIFKASFLNSWYPDQPLRNSGNRCIRILPGCLDPVLIRAATESDIDIYRLQHCLPQVLTLWIDPGCVCYRTHDRAHVLIIYEEALVNSDVDSYDDLHNVGGNEVNTVGDYPISPNNPYRYQLYEQQTYSYSAPGSPFKKEKVRNKNASKNSNVRIASSAIHVGTS